ncbi:MAG: class I SAM-dependent methyltransferase [Oscillospiraceae bacterium]
MQSLNKYEIQAFFDKAAPSWDAHMVRSDEKISCILNAADVKAGYRVLDVACGTGVLLGDYLARDVNHITGVDVSYEMLRIARDKYRDPRVELLCADALELTNYGSYDCAVVYNAFPHFPKPALLIKRLAKYLRPGGRLCVAHGMSREALLVHHSGAALNVSLPLPELNDMAALFYPYFNVDVQISDDEKFIIAGSKK